MTYDDDFDVDTTGDYELSERQALRRVEGLSTELEDITEAEYRQVRLERVILVGVWTDGTAQDVERSMTELARLAETAGSNVLDAFVQRRDAPDASTFIGSGKVLELREAVVAHRADTVICDGDLTPSQLRTLEERLKVKVVDRTWLILDIFARRARTRWRRRGLPAAAAPTAFATLPASSGLSTAMARGLCLPVPLCRAPCRPPCRPLCGICAARRQCHADDGTAATHRPVCRRASGGVFCRHERGVF